MKKFALSAIVVLSFVFYAFQKKKETIFLPQQKIAPETSLGRYKDGEYLGSEVDAYYGIVQVKVKITGGKITQVQFVQYPSDQQTSKRINDEATPILAQEAIIAQNEQVEIVSGATQTSGAFRESLKTALDKARA